MENLAKLSKDKEKLLESVEELYEDNVEIQCRNDPTISRRDCSRQFWADLRHFLPKATVLSLIHSVKLRRTMREQSRQEALAILQEIDLPPKNRKKRTFEESNAKVVNRRTPSRSRRESNRMSQSAAAVVTEEKEHPRRKRPKRIIDDSDEVVFNHTDLMEEAIVRASAVRVKEKDSPRTKRNVGIPKESASKSRNIVHTVTDVRSKKQRKRRRRLSRRNRTRRSGCTNATPPCPKQADHGHENAAILSWSDLSGSTSSRSRMESNRMSQSASAVAMEEKEILRKKRSKRIIEDSDEVVFDHPDLMDETMVRASDVRVEEKDSLRTKKSLNVSKETVPKKKKSRQRMTVESLEKEPSKSRKARDGLCLKESETRSRANLSSSIPSDSMEDMIRQSASTLVTDEKKNSQKERSNSKRIIEDSDEVVFDYTDLMDETSVQTSIMPIEVEEKLRPKKILNIPKETSLKDKKSSPRMRVESPEKNPSQAREGSCLKRSTTRSRANLSSFPSASMEDMISQSAAALVTDEKKITRKERSKRVIEDSDEVIFDYIDLMEEPIVQALDARMEKEDCSRTKQTLNFSNEIFPEKKKACQRVTVEPLEDEVTISVTLPSQTEESSKSPKCRVGLRPKKPATLSWTDLSAFPHDSEGFLLYLEHLYHSNVTCGRLSGLKFWCDLKTHFPNADVEDLSQKLRNRRRYSSTRKVIHLPECPEAECSGTKEADQSLQNAATLSGVEGASLSPKEADQSLQNTATIALGNKQRDRGRKMMTLATSADQAQKQMVDISWEDLSALSPGSEDFFLRLENLYSSHVESRQLPASEFWSHLKSQFPDLDMKVIRQKVTYRIRKTKKRNLRVSSGRDRTTVRTMSWGDLSNFCSDSKEFLLQVENLYNNNKESGQCTTREFWSQFKIDFPNTNTKVLRIKLNERRHCLRKIEAQRGVFALFGELSKDPFTPSVKQLFEEAWEEFGVIEGDVKVVRMNQFRRITENISKFPSFFNDLFYQRILDAWICCHPNTNPEAVTMEMMEFYWKKCMEPFDEVDRFFILVKPLAVHDHIVPADFLPFIHALLREHPGLKFLSSYCEFQEKYAVTVIARIFYDVDTFHTGRITSQQVRVSNMYEAFLQVDQEENTSKITRYFSYEHFFVLYRRFWELDQDHDFQISREDLFNYGDRTLSHVIVDRIFDAAPRPSTFDASTSGKRHRNFMSYEDFVYFMLSEEDKNNESSIRYWFQCVDLNGDGKLDLMEIRYFYFVQLYRMNCMGHRIVPLEDMLCEIEKVIKPASTHHFVVNDFLHSSSHNGRGALFDAMFSLKKYMNRLEQQRFFQLA